MQKWHEVAIKRQWQWAFRIYNMSSNRWPRIISLWNAASYESASRGRGRPKQRWEDHLTNFAKSYGYNHWMEFAHQFNTLWKSMETDFVNFVCNDNTF
eukprot:10915047-Karenia_brevis.AAC.1